MALMMVCPDCQGDGEIYHSRRGGNDPDGWSVDCERCDKAGEVNTRCDCCPDGLAVSVIDGTAFCAACEVAEFGEKLAQ